MDTSDRVDHLGRAFAGSQRQIQHYVNCCEPELTGAVLQALPSLATLRPGVRWVSPLESQKYAEYKDADFLEALGLGRLAGLLGEFWPRGGPWWDGLAAIELSGGAPSAGALLVEAKSHPPEVYGPGCGATEPSRFRIEKSLASTKEWLRLSREMPSWTGRLYQSANRLAHLYFLREVARVPAWLVNVYFVNDPHSPTTREQWTAANELVKMELGIAGIELPHVASVFLEARC